MKKQPTKQEVEDYSEKLLNKFKEDPQYELMQELGMFLMRNINDLTPDERKRYDELNKILTTKEI